MPIKLVCLNLNRCDTRQQPVPANRPASRTNKKAAAERIYQCTYTVERCMYTVHRCLYNSWNVCSHLYTEHCLYVQVCTLYVHVCMMQTLYVNVQTCTYMSEQCTYMFVAFIVHTMYIPCTYMFMIFHFCTYHVYTCIYISWFVYTCLSSVHTLALSEACTYMVQTCTYMFIPGGKDSRWLDCGPISKSSYDYVTIISIIRYYVSDTMCHYVL